MDMIFESEIAPIKKRDEKQNNWVEKLENSTSELFLMHSVKWFNTINGCFL